MKTAILALALAGLLASGCDDGSDASTRGCDATNTTAAPADGLIKAFSLPGSGVNSGVVFGPAAAAPTFTTDGALRINVEFAERDELFILPFRAQGPQGIPRKNIDDRAAHAELAATLHLGFADVAGLLQLGEKLLAIDVRVFDEGQPMTGQPLGRGEWLLGGTRGREDYARETTAKLVQRGKAFRRGLGIG